VKFGSDFFYLDCFNVQEEFMRFNKSALAIATLVAAAIFSAQAKANVVNIVQNGGFETGDFTDWTTGANSFPQYIVTSPVEEGTYAAQIAGYSSNPDTLSQILTTTAGQSYEVSFWRSQAGGGPTISLNVTWDNKTIFSELNPTTINKYQEFTAIVSGTGSDTLKFTSANDPAYTYLDNVSVSAVPEPATWGMMLIGFAGLGFMAYRGKSKPAMQLA
jgi:hypothetical protein